MSLTRTRLSLAAAALAAGVLAAAGGWWALGESGAGEDAGPGQMTVYKTPDCDCCTYWEDHLRAHGFEVESVVRRDLTPIKIDKGLTRQLASCHTGVIDGYVIEGHVPAADVKRLLEERPAVHGLAVPGMPVGSPGMEIPGREDDAYDVLAFDEDGNVVEVFNSYR